MVEEWFVFPNVSPTPKFASWERRLSLNDARTAQNLRIKDIPLITI